MALITSVWTYDLLILIGAFIFLSYLKFRLHSRYFWKKLNIPHLEPNFIIGNTWKANFVASTPEVFDQIYQSNSDKGILGIWFFTKPVLFVHDLALIKNILVKDFQYFHDRGINIDEKAEPLTGHLFNLNGAKWRNLRVKLTPTFTSGKMKMMFPTMVECGKELDNFLTPSANKNDVIEIKDILARFTTNIISSCAFGIQTDSLKNPDGEFRRYGKKIFNPGYAIIFSGLAAFLFPFLDKIMTLRRVPKDVSDFFMNAVRETIDAREKGNIKRRDFMDLLIQLKNKGKIEDVDSKTSEPQENQNSEESGDQFTVEQAAAQAFVFFAAGFETSSTAMTFAFYELAKNPDVQRKLQKEIDTVLARHDGELSYDAVQEMEYLDCVVNESLRMYAPVGTLFRECTKDYTIPEYNVTIKKGMSVMIPFSGLQNDPKYYPNPKQFRPERFLPAEKAQRDHFLHLPFGEGPRNCIGNRFGLLQSKVGLAAVLAKYDVDVAEETPIPLKLDPKSFIPSPIKGMPLRISNRKL